jgi:hypothetical protein
MQYYSGSMRRQFIMNRKNVHKKWILLTGRGNLNNNKLDLALKLNIYGGNIFSPPLSIYYLPTGFVNASD